jgi:hypothetical protein
VKSNDKALMKDALARMGHAIDLTGE